MNKRPLACWLLIASSACSQAHEPSAHDVNMVSDHVSDAAAADGGDASLFDADGALPECAWSPSLDELDAARGSCHAARVLLECSGPGGEGEICLTDNVQRCPDEAVTTNCHDSCKPDEYGVVCGAIGPITGSPASNRPSNCQLMPPSPSGIGFYCCKCE